MRARPLRDAGLGRRCACGSRASGCSRKVSPWHPAGTHLCLPKKLTKAPGKPHPSLPDVLTDTSRRPSPIRPGKAHRRLPQRLTGYSRRGSPATPGKAHQALPYRLTSALLKKLTRGSRKVSPIGKIRIFEADMRRSMRVKPCKKQRCGMDIAAGGTRLAAPYERRYFRCEQAPTRSWLLRSRDTFKCSAFLTVNIRNMPGGWRHPRHATSPRVGSPADATAAASS